MAAWSSKSTRPANIKWTGGSETPSTGPAGSRFRASPISARRTVPPWRGGVSSPCSAAIGGATLGPHATGPIGPRARITAAHTTRGGDVRSGVSRIERIAQAFSKQVEPPNRQQDRCRGCDHQSRRRQVLVLALEQHPAPRGRGRREADAEVAEDAVGHDHLRDQKGRGDNQGPDDVRENVLQKNPRG